MTTTGAMLRINRRIRRKTLVRKKNSSQIDPTTAKSITPR
jgi:hypothetical protein